MSESQTKLFIPINNAIEFEKAKNVLLAYGYRFYNQPTYETTHKSLVVEDVIIYRSFRASAHEHETFLTVDDLVTNTEKVLIDNNASYLVTPSIAIAESVLTLLIHNGVRVLKGDVRTHILRRTKDGVMPVTHKSADHTKQTTNATEFIDECIRCAIGIAVIDPEGKRVVAKYNQDEVTLTWNCGVAVMTKAFLESVLRVVQLEGSSYNTKGFVMNKQMVETILNHFK